MLKRLTLAAVAVLAFAAPAKSNSLEDYIYSNPVLEVVHSSGTRILFKSEDCRTRNIYGSYNGETDVMTICIRNHPDIAELGDTIRHEAFHIIQECNGGPVLGLTKLIGHAQQTDHDFIAMYPPHAQHI